MLFWRKVKNLRHFSLFSEGICNFIMKTTRVRSVHHTLMEVISVCEIACTPACRYYLSAVCNPLLRS